jgi:flagellin
MVQMAAKLQTAFSADGIKVAWATNGAVYSTGTSAASGQTSAALTKTGAALTAAAAGFVIYNATGDQITNISLTVDQASGGNVAATVAEVRNGSNAALVYDLDTTAQTRAQYVIAVASGASTAAQTKSSNSGSTTVNGADVQATLTTATGKVINLKSTTAVTGSVINLGLTTGSQADGFQGVSLSISNAYAVAGGQTSFKLTNGAEFQIGANEGQKAGITIDAVTASELGRNVSGAGTLESLEDLLSTKKSALTAGLTSEALKVIDAAIDEVTNQRGKMGAFQGNTLETNLNSLRVSSENLTAAESVIRDTDYAAESARFTRNQILVQASQSMLAQANQLPQSVLQLLQ